MADWLRQLVQSNESKVATSSTSVSITSNTSSRSSFSREPPFKKASIPVIPEANSFHNGYLSCDWSPTPLPKPPIPSLEHTLERYLQHASVVRSWDEVPAEDVESAVGRFFPIAEALQDELKEIAEVEENWIVKYWLETMYLKPRYPLPVYSSPGYIFPRQVFYDEDDWLLFAAWMAKGILNFKDLIDKRGLEQDKSRSGYPMCMDQYDRLLGIYRQPAVGCDKHLSHRYRNGLNADQHLLVMCEAQAFILYVRKDGVALGPTEIAAQLREIVNKARNRNRVNVTPIAAATGAQRDEAATFWESMLEHERNAKSLKLIQDAVFAVCLDGCVPHRAFHDNHLETAGDLILHGCGSDAYGLNRWFDTTIQLVVSLDGFNGLAIEHSVAEGMVIITMMEHVQHWVNENRPTHARLPPFLGNVQHEPLSWVVTEENKAKLDKFVYDYDNLVTDLRLTVYTFEEYGKEKIKRMGVSPDGFVQLAMQLAHFRLHGYLVSTYESATLRKFRYGRVDNIRAATPEALAWVQSMNDRSVPDSEKRSLFEKAAKKQFLLTGENINGFGIDNHLCALECLAKENVSRGRLKRMPEMFEQQTYRETLRFPLTTSQVSTNPVFEGTYLCYGPVVNDGYGCAYNIQPHKIIFAISDMKSNDRTNGIAFEQALKDALESMNYLLSVA
ncbi:unnamed protein product [Bursaphelenchus xylophilus]|uniref:Choline O-acetyltransferase n=1 Tax=Bursaphelenchus xylophilus TaxID=6326 RepID=A0A811LKB7_BURXY|nr:unnamed protein product [Bursaphelenchus xylophilus]CAG9118332.1 unnamed protein product [Bursaphelenchus xylophilus]